MSSINTGLNESTCTPSRNTFMACAENTPIRPLTPSRDTRSAPAFYEVKRTLEVSSDGLQECPLYSKAAPEQYQPMQESKSASRLQAQEDQG